FIEGVVTGRPFEFAQNEFGFQDSSGAGLVINDPSNIGVLSSGITPGVYARVTGNLMSITGMTVLRPTTTITTPAPPQPLPTPKVVRIADLSDETEGLLIAIRNVNVTATGFWTTQSDFT